VVDSSFVECLKIVRNYCRGSFFNISNDAGRVKGLGTVGFMISYTLITSAQTHCFPSRSNQPCFFVDLYPTAWLGPVRLHHCGGVAHQTSLRSRSIMMCYSNSPPFGEAGGLFS